MLRHHGDLNIARRSDDNWCFRTNYHNNYSSRFVSNFDAASSYNKLVCHPVLCCSFF